MKAAVIEKPGVLVVREIPIPEVGDYDALCQILYGATCSGTDQHLIAGHFPWPVRYPTVLGHESVGRVVQVGPKVRHYRVGDLISRVGTVPAPDRSLSVNWGGFTEYGIAVDHRAMREDGLPPEAWRRYGIHQVLPPAMDPAGATMVITWRETLSYITRMGVCPGASVLAIGSGGNGLSFAAHAANLGADRVVMIGNEQRREVGLAVGATDYLDYRAEDLSERVSRAAPSNGFDFVIDAVGKTGALDDVLGLVRAGGTVGIYGIDDYGACQIHPQQARGTFTYYNGGYEEAETHERVVSLIQEGRLRAELWVDLEHPFSLDDIGQAIKAVRARKVVKALVRM